MDPGDAPRPDIIEWCRNVFGASHDPYALLDAEGRYLWFNKAGIALFGYSPEEVVGTHFRDYLVQGEAPGNVFAGALRGAAGDVVRHVRRKDGAIAPVLAELLPASDGLILVHATDLREVFSDVRQLRSNTVLQALLDSSPDGIWLMDSDLRVAQFNRSAARLLKSLTGNEPRIGAIFGVDGNGPEDNRGEMRQLAETALAGRNVNSIRTFTDIEERTRVAHFNAFPVITPGGAPLGIALVVREITEQVETERAARERLELLTRSESIANTGTWVYRIAQGTIEWTDGMYRLADLPAERGPDMDAYVARVHPADRDRVRDTLLQRRKGGGTLASTPYRIVIGSGETRWVDEFISVERDSQGNVGTLVGTMQDVTDRILAEEQTRQAERMEAVTRVVGGIAHDLNNYLSAILGPIDLVRAGDERAEYWLTMADNSARRAAAVVRQLVQLVRPATPRLEQFPLAEAVRDAFDSSGLTPEPVFDAPNGPVEITADRARLTQVILTLLANADDAVRAKMAAGVPGYVPSIRVTISGDTEAVAFTVTDNGIGMDDDARRRALEPYFSTKPSGHAVGLSLTIAHRIVTEHRGFMDIQSEPGVGTTVTVTIPRTPDVVPASGTPMAGHTGARILIVDDEAAVRTVEVAVLEDAGHVPVAVASGDEAIEACRQQEFDLVLLNVHMPGRSGLDTLNVLQSEHPTLRVAMVTGSDIAAQVADRQVAGVVRKPWTGPVLVQAVQSFLQAGA